LSSTPKFNEQQLSTARAERWHQDGAALLTLEDARTWVGEAGLVLFAPRAQQLATPAPSLVEATLGKATDAPTAAESETARSFVARLTAEGDALPLNLLGGPGDVPDFVVSAQVFSYVFTVRGDKLWKQPPATSGAMKVSLLAAKVYEAVAEGKALTAAELASELGREVTEAAIGRALGELWAQLRVIPLLQQDGSAALWELTSRRFTKTMKAGGNAGLPTALSALVSMYLAQVFAATEEEIETFLSPLTARSRVRDVLHALLAARELDTVAIEGKTVLHVAGDAPAFLNVEASREATAALAESIDGPADAGTEERPEVAEPVRDEADNRFLFGVTLDQFDEIGRLLDSLRALGNVVTCSDHAELSDVTLSIMGDAIVRDVMKLRDIISDVNAQDLEPPHGTKPGVREEQASYLALPMRVPMSNALPIVRQLPAYH